MNSGHEVRVVPVVLEKHPNADFLSIVHIDGYQVVVRTEDWTDKKFGAYIPPDNIVPNTPEYDFLGSSKRIRVRKFRNVISQGLLVESPKGSKVGDNVTDILGIKHYEPPVKGYQGEQRPSPFHGIPIYDVEHYLKYKDEFRDKEEVIITEKIHGTNARFVYHNGKFYVGTHRTWVRDPKEYNSIWYKFKRAKNLKHLWKILTSKEKVNQNLYWKVFNDNIWLQDLCTKYPNHVFYGEIYGDVQKLTYGYPNGSYSVRLFDVCFNGTFLDFSELMAMITELYLIEGGGYDLHIAEEKVVPILYLGEFNDAKCQELFEGNSVLPYANCIKEGIVIRTSKETISTKCGRMVLKLVSNQYLQGDF